MTGRHDPTPEFWMLLHEIEAGRVPEKAVAWFDEAFEKVDSINATIPDTRANGIAALTERQADALANLHRAACRWLARVPIEEEYEAEMLTHREADAPHTSYRTMRECRSSTKRLRVKHPPRF